MDAPPYVEEDTPPFFRAPASPPPVEAPGFARSLPARLGVLVVASMFAAGLGFALSHLVSG